MYILQVVIKADTLSLGWFNHLYFELLKAVGQPRGSKKTSKNVEVHFGSCASGNKKKTKFAKS